MLRVLPGVHATPPRLKRSYGGNGNVNLQYVPSASRVPRRRAASRRASDNEAVNVTPIEELHAALPFSLEAWNTFMREYWQKRPVVIRGATLPGESMPIDAGELAGLACEPEFQPRIIRNKSGKPSEWKLERGPFAEEELRALPEDGTWCVVVNDLEKHVPEVATLLDLFDHFPRWRVADIQASLSAEGGGVGAHSDQFDVFLIQGEGQKLWSISDNPEYAPENEDAFYAEAEVKVLRDFQPRESSLLEPGDVLYLPPKVAHHGVAKGSDTVCTTYSVGFLAPTRDDLVLSLAQSTVDTGEGTRRWSDPWLEPQENVGMISAKAVTQASTIIREAMPKDDAGFARWFGCHVTAGYSLESEGFVADDQITDDDFLTTWIERESLFPRADVKFAFVDEVSDGSLEGSLFFAAGDVWELLSDRGSELARHIANRREIVAEDWVEHNETGYRMETEAQSLLHDLFSSGYLFLED